MKKLLVFMMALFLVLLSGCTGNHAKPADSGHNKPQHIVSLGVSNDEIVLELVEPSRIAAIGDIASNLPDRAAQVRGKAHSNIESVMSIQPDLFIGADWMSPDFLEQVRQSGVPVYVSKTPHHFAEVAEEIRAIGKVVGEEAGAEKLVEKMQAEEKSLQQMVAAARKSGKRAPRVVYYSSFGIGGGQGSFFAEICRLAGMKDAAEEAGLKQGETLSKERLVDLAPDVIVIAGSEYDTGKYHALRKDEILHDPSLQTIPAVRNQQICVVDARHLLSLNHFALEAAKRMAEFWYQDQGEKAA